MPTKLNRNDRDLLVALAEYRILTVSQIASLCSVGKAAARNRVAKLTNEHLAVQRTPGTAQGRGRPERWVSIAERGIELLRANGTLGKRVPKDAVAADGIRCAEHLLATNWFRIHLVNLERVFPRLKVMFLSSTSPFLDRGHDGHPLVSDTAAAADADGEAARFTPDGVFTLTDQEAGKTLLFFLEVDQGTETLASGRRGTKDIRGKIINYQCYFRSTGYKRYQHISDCTLNGFRLLFLAHTSARLAALCRFVQESRPSDFVWLTDQDRLSAQGVAADIWARGGKLDAPRESIVGRAFSRVAPRTCGRGAHLAKPVGPS